MLRALNEDVCGETFFLCVGADWGSPLAAVVYCPAVTKSRSPHHMHLAAVHSLSSLSPRFLPLGSCLSFSPGMVVVSRPFLGDFNSASVNNRIDQGNAARQIT